MGHERTRIEILVPTQFGFRCVKPNPSVPYSGTLTVFLKVGLHFSLTNYIKTGTNLLQMLRKT